MPPSEAETTREPSSYDTDAFRDAVRLLVHEVPRESEIGRAFASLHGALPLKGRKLHAFTGELGLIVLALWAFTSIAVLLGRLVDWLVAHAWLPGFLGDILPTEIPSSIVALFPKGMPFGPELSVWIGAALAVVGLVALWVIVATGRSLLAVLGLRGSKTADDPAASEAAAEAAALRFAEAMKRSGQYDQPAFKCLANFEACRAVTRPVHGCIAALVICCAAALKSAPRSSKSPGGE